jgi:glycosyltransferase involved in cell wall biosynthesis
MSRLDGSPHEVLWARSSRAWPHPEAVTVAVSLYNYAQYLPACLDSVAAQSHPHLELVIVDDASHLDGSAAAGSAWLDTHADRFDRALLLRHTHNRGLAAARNTAFAAARTDYVFVLDADNLLAPAALARLHAAAVDRPFDAAYAQLEFFEGRVGLGDADVWSRRRLAEGPYIDAMALVSRRSWREVGGYDHIEGGWEDYDFWCKFAEAGLSAVFLPEPLLRYRVHGGSMTRESTLASRAAIIENLTARHPWLHVAE